MIFRRKKIEINIKGTKGITLMDVTIAAILFAIFTSLIANLMYIGYRTAIDIEQTANANAYATIIMEKVDEKTFESIDNDFLTTIANEIEVNSEKYRISFQSEYLEDDSNYQIDGNSIFKEATVTVEYGKDFEKKITLKKIKVKEMENM